MLRSRGLKFCLLALNTYKQSFGNCGLGLAQIVVLKCD